MSTRTIHMCLSVRGALRWGNREFRQALKWTKKSDGTAFANIEELREELMDQLAQGHEVIPYGECDNFDPKTGCKGHEEKAETKA